MMRFRPRLTYANVMATIAVFGVLAGGGAYAASKIGPKDLKRNAVRTKHIKNRAVTAPKLRDRAVRTRKLAPSTKGVALAGADIGDGLVINWFNRFGGEPTFTHDEPGVYEVAFPGLEGRLGAAAIVSATLFEEPGTLIQSATGGADTIRIDTFDDSGSPADRDFDLVVMAPS